jgi:predicted amidohydrolase
MTNWETAHMDEYRSYIKARAFENSIYVAGANRVGEDVTLNFGGESMVVGPRGKVYASLADEKNPETNQPAEGFCVARIDLDEVRKYREEFQFLQSRQPLVYKTIVKRY